MLPAIRSLATYVFIALYVLVLGPPCLLIALLFRSPALLYRVGHFGVWTGLRLSGIRMIVEGAEHIQLERPAVYAANHTSQVEPANRGQ